MDDTKGLHESDLALIEAAKTGEGCVELTPDLLRDIGEDIRARVDAFVPEKPSLEGIAWVISKIDDAREAGASFRFMMYEIMGLGPEAYLHLYTAGGMNITNAFCDIEDLERYRKEGKMCSILMHIEAECPSCPSCGEDWERDGGEHLDDCRWEELKKLAKGIEAPYL